MKTYNEYLNNPDSSPLAQALWIVERAKKFGLKHKAIERWEAKEKFLEDMQSNRDSEEEEWKYGGDPDNAIHCQLNTTEEALIEAGEAAWNTLQD
tara:strand:- start:1017 stop:1301 length:285 start_codon:yes stop_codon:yes gene_type:complete